MILSTGIFLALAVSVVSESYQVVPDRMIEASAAARAAEKIGTIRGSISYKEAPRSMSVKRAPAPIIVPSPVTSEPAMQPVTDQRDTFGVDTMPTGSIQKMPAKPTRQWQIFDAQGKPVYR